MGAANTAESSNGVDPSTASDIVAVDRRRNNRRTANKTGKAAKANKTEDNSPVADADQAEPRRKKQRRRHIDPTTCERDYSEDELQFMRAMDDYKQSSGRMFPTCSEVLEVLRSLGYFQLTEDQMAQLGLGADDSDESEDARTLDDELQLQEDEEELLAS